MKMSKEGIDLIKKSEGFRSEMYNDVAGHCTIGYGYLIHKGPINGSEPQEFKDGITEERATELLIQMMTKFENTVNDAVEVDLTQGQFNALVDFCYNCGSGNFLNSTLLKKVNAEDFDSVPDEFRRWVYATDNNGVRKVVNGLLNRRNSEIDMWNS